MDARETPLDWLYGIQHFGIKLGLEGITRLLRELGVLYPRANVVHVAGTNGKGSTCAIIESIARTAGYRTGLFTSPHLIDFRERIRVCGAMIPAADLDRHIIRIREHIKDWDAPPTFFEIVLAIALLHFAENETDLIILETGMGGRLDATNAVPKDVAVITPIGIDHAQYLGSTLYAIGSEKAGIISWHRPVISAAQQPEARRAIDEACAAMDTGVYYCEEPIPYTCNLPGAHQLENARMAVAALAELPGLLIEQRHIAEGLNNVQWPGRFEEIRPGIIMDGAHNPHAMHTLLDTWHATFGSRQATCIFAASADKAVEENISLLSPIVGEWILPPVDSPRILPPADAQTLIAATCTAPCTLAATLPEALRLAEQRLAEGSGPILICGSFFLLGEARAHLTGAAYRPTAQ